ncbi:pyrroline-5-carboxylate reductase [Candidatus Woesearchaeota archaeon]|nr:pyrroline-5-carboxylate reductase [Candidatus Woesearchaeota archaeon]
MRKLGFIGSGKMATALMKSLSGSQYAISASDRSREKIKGLEKSLKIKAFSDNISLAKHSDIIFICVKPQDIEAVLDEIKEAAKGKLIVSIAAGISLAFIRKKLSSSRIIRVMPNVLCDVGKMAAAFSLGKGADREDAVEIKKILGFSGISFEVREKELDAVTAVSGSGPAFVAYLIRCFINKGKEMELSDEISKALALQTIEGTAKMLSEKGIRPEELIKMVMSPNGTTYAGMQVLENSDVHKIIGKTLEAARKRAVELGR